MEHPGGQGQIRRSTASSAFEQSRKMKTSKWFGNLEVISDLDKRWQMVKIMIDGGSGGDKEEKLKAAHTGNLFKVFWYERRKRKRAITREKSGIKKPVHKDERKSNFLHWLEHSSQEREILMLEEKRMELCSSVNGARIQYIIEMAC